MEADRLAKAAVMQELAARRQRRLQRLYIQDQNMNL